MKIKKLSRRVQIHRRCNIEKKVNAHHRGVRKEAKKSRDVVVNKKLGRKARSGIPNSCPFKMELMKEASLTRNKWLLSKGDQMRAIEEIPVPDYRSYAESANKASIDWGIRGIEMDDGNIRTPGINELKDCISISNNSLGLIMDVIRKSDTLVEVLDARDPEGSRNKELENLVARSGKRLILLLNKIDLVPISVTDAWITRLKKEYPTIGFKASKVKTSADTTIPQKRGRKFCSAIASSSTVIGNSRLMQLLSNFARDTGGKISAGFIGFPNVGKSSVIRSMKRGGVGKHLVTGNTPGLTRRVQMVKVDSKVSLVDTPGVLLENPNLEGGLLISQIIRKGISINQSTIPDLMGAVVMCVSIFGRDPLIRLVSFLESKLTTDANIMCDIDFINSDVNMNHEETAKFIVTKIAKSRGKLKKGGAVDTEEGCIELLKMLGECSSKRNKGCGFLIYTEPMGDMESRWVMKESNSLRNSSFLEK